MSVAEKFAFPTREGRHPCLRLRVREQCSNKFFDRQSLTGSDRPTVLRIRTANNKSPWKTEGHNIDVEIILIRGPPRTPFAKHQRLRGQLTTTMSYPRSSQARPDSPKPLADSKAAASVAVLHAGLRQPRQGAALLSQEQDFVVCATAPHSGVEGAQIVREHSGRVFARYGAQKLKFAMVKLCLTFP